MFWRYLESLFLIRLVYHPSITTVPGDGKENIPKKEAIDEFRLLYFSSPPPPKNEARDELCLELCLSSPKIDDDLCFLCDEEEECL